MFRPFGFIALKTLNYLSFSNLSILREPYEGYSRNASSVLNLISTFLLRDSLRVIIDYPFSLNEGTREII